MGVTGCSATFPAVAPTISSRKRGRRRAPRLIPKPTKILVSLRTIDP